LDRTTAPLVLGRVDACAELIWENIACEKNSHKIIKADAPCQ